MKKSFCYLFILLFLSCNKENDPPIPCYQTGDQVSFKPNQIAEALNFTEVFNLRGDNGKYFYFRRISNDTDHGIVRSWVPIDTVSDGYCQRINYHEKIEVHYLDWEYQTHCKFLLIPLSNVQYCLQIQWMNKQYTSEPFTNGMVGFKPLSTLFNDYQSVIQLHSIQQDDQSYIHFSPESGMVQLVFPTGITYNQYP